MGLSALRRLLAASLILCLTVGGAQSYWQSRSQVSVGAAVYAGPGDVVSGATAWYGLRGYNAAYSGNAVNVCLPSDSVCADVTISAGNLVVPGSLSTCNNSGTICSIKIWYDQSGANGCAGSPCNATQATEANRAKFVIPGAANGCTTTANYCATLAANGTYASAANVTAIAQPYSYSFVGSRTGAFTTQQSWVVNNSSILVNVGFQNSANTLFAFAGSTGTKASVNDSAFHALQTVINNASSVIAADGSESTVTAGTRTFGGGTGGVVNIFVSAMTATVTEVGIWPAGFSAQNRTDLNTNQHNYWGF